LAVITAQAAAAPVVSETASLLASMGIHVTPSLWASTYCWELHALTQLGTVPEGVTKLEVREGGPEP